MIKGGSLENAVVIRDDAVLTTEPLRYPDEFVRHKILDMLGDLSLLGYPLAGHIVAVRPSHTVNCELARMISAQMRKPLVAMQTFSPPPSPRIQEVPSPAEIEAMMGNTSGLDIQQLMQILPHRYPFLMVDRILSFEGETKCVGIKSVTINEPFFQGHFPGHPVMPGVLQVEAMAQVASVLMMRISKSASRVGYFMSADGVKFRKPVFPGDTLFIHAELTKSRGNRLAKAMCRCVVNDAVVSEGELMFTFLDK